MRKLVLVACASVVFCSCGAEEVSVKSKGPMVTVKQVTSASVPLIVEAVGSVEAYNSVAVVARVSGQLIDLKFKEGQDVVKDAPLLTIDPAPYEERLREAEANLARDKSLLEFKKSEAERYKLLVDRGVVSRSDYDKNRLDSDAQEELIRADEAAAAQARLNLSYCHITSPFTGRTGRALAKEGTIVEANKTQLVVINQIKPIYVTFSIPEKYLTDLRKYQKEGTLQVTAQPSGYSGAIPNGVLSFIDNAVDAGTGMILLKADFPNEDALLWPGQFVTVGLSLMIQKDAVVAPSEAILTGQKGTYLYVVGSDNTVTLRFVTVDRAYGQMTVVAQGVSPGESVITDGQNRVQNGAKVIIKDASPLPSDEQ
jgi:membrane fusion protein, multidrug efflux system